MKTTKLVVGILSIVLSVLVAFQSMFAGLGNALAENGETSGSGGILVSLVLLVAGIVAISTRKAGKGGIVAGVFYAVGGLIGFTNAGSYTDLNIWAGLCIIFAILFIVGDTLSNKKKKVA